MSPRSKPGWVWTIKRLNDKEQSSSLPNHVPVSQPTAPGPSVASRSNIRVFQMERTEQWTLEDSRGRAYEISVSLPKQPASADGYPVLYVLDASTAFATLADMVRNHESMFGPAVVVGIGYPSEAEAANRIFDLTPITDPTTLPAYRTEGWGPVGGADAFLAFMRDTLMPDIDSLVSTDKRRQALLGHSLGGLFVLHALFTQPASFDTYVAASPAIWWGNALILKRVPTFVAELQEGSGLHHRLLICVGELEHRANPEEIPAAIVMSLDLVELRRQTRMVENAASLAQRLSSLASHRLQVTFTPFASETHTSVIPAYLSRGARFALKGWLYGGDSH